MPDEYISREAALEDFESCNAENPNWTPQRVKTLLLRQPAADVAPGAAIPAAGNGAACRKRRRKEKRHELRYFVQGKSRRG